MGQFDGVFNDFAKQQAVLNAEAAKQDEARRAQRDAFVLAYQNWHTATLRPALEELAAKAQAEGFAAAIDDKGHDQAGARTTLELKTVQAHPPYHRATFVVQMYPNSEKLKIHQTFGTVRPDVDSDVAMTALSAQKLSEHLIEFLQKALPALVGQK